MPDAPRVHVILFVWFLTSLYDITGPKDCGQKPEALPTQAAFVRDVTYQRRFTDMPESLNLRAASEVSAIVGDVSDPVQVI